MWKKTLYLLLGFCFIVVTTAIFKYVYRPHKDIQASEASFTVTAKYLAKEFSNDAEATSTKFLNTTLEVSGTITESDGQIITLDAAVLCYFKDNYTITNKPLLTIKGRCIGYDELLEVVKLDQCSIINQN